MYGPAPLWCVSFAGDTSPVRRVCCDDVHDCPGASVTSSRMLKKGASIVSSSLRGSTYRMRFSEIGNTKGAYPFAKIHLKGERSTRSAVCASSPLRSLRPCWRPV